MADTNDHLFFSLKSPSETISAAGESETDQGDTSSTNESHNLGSDAVDAYLWDPDRPWEPLDSTHYGQATPSGNDADSSSSQVNVPDENETDSGAT